MLIGNNEFIHESNKNEFVHVDYNELKPAGNNELICVYRNELMPVAYCLKR